MDIQILPEFKHDNILQSQKGKLEDRSSKGHQIGWESHCLPKIKHDNISQSQKGWLEDCLTNGMSQKLDPLATA